mmetsp:Transcript_48831/g.156995  ORF Transcript_48831/g.156995 Transcript_48831/m.156995 type:complete len:309 (-) Transcript_48831:56-982(-)
MAFAPLPVPVTAGKGLGKGGLYLPQPQGRHVPHPAPHPSQMAIQAQAEAPQFLSRAAEVVVPPMHNNQAQALFFNLWSGPQAMPPTQPQLTKGAPVVLHVYHLSGHFACGHFDPRTSTILRPGAGKRRIKFTNQILRLFGTGVYHAAVEVHGLEWSFGAKRFGTGVFSCVPTGCGAHTYKKPYLVGYTSLSVDQVQGLVDKMADEWQGRDYELLRRNCTHFSRDFCERLGVGAVPSWVTSLAAAGARLEDVRDVGTHAKVQKGQDPGSPVGDFVEGLATLGKDHRGARTSEKTECADVARGCRRCCAC